MTTKTKSKTKTFTTADMIKRLKNSSSIPKNVVVGTLDRVMNNNIDNSEKILTEIRKIINVSHIVKASTKERVSYTLFEHMAIYHPDILESDDYRQLIGNFSGNFIYVKNALWNNKQVSEVFENNISKHTIRDMYIGVIESGNAKKIKGNIKFITENNTLTSNVKKVAFTFSVSWLIKNDRNWFVEQTVKRKGRMFVLQMINTISEALSFYNEGTNQDEDESLDDLLDEFDESEDIGNEIDVGHIVNKMLRDNTDSPAIYIYGRNNNLLYGIGGFMLDGSCQHDWFSEQCVHYDSKNKSRRDRGAKEYAGSLYSMDQVLTFDSIPAKYSKDLNRYFTEILNHPEMFGNNDLNMDVHHIGARAVKVMLYQYMSENIEKVVNSFERLGNKNKDHMTKDFDISINSYSVDQNDHSQSCSNVLRKINREKIGKGNIKKEIENLQLDICDMVDSKSTDFFDELYDKHRVTRTDFMCVFMNILYSSNPAFRVDVEPVKVNIGITMPSIDINDTR